MVVMRNFTGWSPMYAMTPDGGILAELPAERTRFHGGPEGVIYTNDGTLCPRPFRLSDVPRPRPNVRILVRPEVARYVGEHSDRTDGTDGRAPK